MRKRENKTSEEATTREASTPPHAYNPNAPAATRGTRI